MQEAVDLVDPVIEVVFWFWEISWLRTPSRETVWSVECTWDVYESKVEHKDRHDPSVDAGGGGDVGIREHTLDILGVNFDYQVS
jgi:hypothetical protein